MATRVADVLRQASGRLAASASPRLDAELLLAEVLACPRLAFFREPERVVTAAELLRYEALLVARTAGVPVAYLLGRAEFWSLTLEVSPAVLIPRADTEILVEAALDCAGTATVLADLGTGSGAIALALAHERPAARIVAVERDAAAMAIAARNCARLGAAGVQPVRGDWLSPLASAAFEAIVANPPYIAADERAALAPELSHEPAAALFAADAGLADLQTIIAQARRALRAGGWLLLEHGAGQAVAVAARFAACGYEAIHTRRDLAGLERVTAGRWP